MIGLKPTYGRVSRRDVLPLAWSLDHVGAIVRGVDDAALVLQVLAGHDRNDPHSARRAVPNFLGDATRGRPPRLGLLPEFLERADPGGPRPHRAGRPPLRGRRARIRELRLPARVDLFLAVHRVTMQAEAAGVHAGWIADNADAYSPRIRAEAMVGQLIPAAAYLHAQRLRRRLREQVDGLFRGLDALLLPTASNLAPPPDTTGDPSFQVPWSLLGLPAISLPSGLGEAGLPFSTQLVAARWHERSLVRAARWCEAQLGWDRQPPLN